MTKFGAKRLRINWENVQSYRHADPRRSAIPDLNPNPDLLTSGSMHAEGLSCTYHRSTNFGVDRGTYKKTNSQTPLKAMSMPRGQLKQLIAQCGTFVT